MQAKAMAVKSMREMTKKGFKEAAEKSPRTAVTKIKEIKEYSKNQFGSVQQKEK